MYGLLVQNIAEYIQDVYGDDVWKAVKDHMKLDQVGCTK